MNFSEVFKERKVQIFSMILFFLGFALWFGSIVFFGFGIAGQVFKLSPSRDIAGILNRAFLSRLNILEFVSAVLLGGGIILYNFRFKTLFHRAPFFLLIVSATLLGVYALMITPNMNDLLLRIPSFDTASDAALKAEFTTYHKIYTSLVQINLILLLALFFWQVLIYSASESYRQGFKKAHDV